MSRPRKMLPFQAYLAAFRDELMPDIMSDYREYLSSLGPNDVRKKRINYMNEWAKDAG